MNARHLALSGEWMTPTKYVEAARTTLGFIYRDPCGSELSNERVRASHLHTKDDDGLSEDNRNWGSTLLVNPPGSCSEPELEEDGESLLLDMRGKPVLSFPGCGDFVSQGKRRTVCSCQLVKRYWRNLVRCWQQGWVEGFVWVGFSLEQLQSLQGTALLAPTDFALCFPAKRIAYDRAGVASKAPPHGSFFAYGGSRPEVFARMFGQFGAVKR